MTKRHVPEGPSGDSPKGSASFAERVRERASALSLTLADLAERAELAPSLLSKLLTETEAVRREPRLEHVLALARALGVAAPELVAGTSAERLLGEWVPRGQYDEETRARGAAQAEAAVLRTELAGAAGEALALRGSIEELNQALVSMTQRLATVEDAARRRIAALRADLGACGAKLLAASQERDQANALAATNYDAYVGAVRHVEHAMHLLAEAKGSASVAWLTAWLGGISLVVVGAAAASERTSSPPAPKRKRLARTLKR